MASKKKTAGKTAARLQELNKALETENGVIAIVKTYDVKIGENGHAFVTIESVRPVFHATDGNSKTGKAGNYNLPIEYTCKHNAPCYQTAACYACNGCYNFHDNQAMYSENLKFFMLASDEEFISAVVAFIDENRLQLFRYFTCGDIPNTRFLFLMTEIAKRRPAVKFWSYTKKYEIVNNFLKSGKTLPENLVIVFSHWLNDDGTYFPMENPFNLPTSEYIPMGKEYLAESVTHVCPCSNPESIETCATCDHPCYTLKPGESMALMEHSTGRTKERDRELKARKAEKKAAAKSAKKAEKAKK